MCKASRVYNDVQQDQTREERAFCCSFIHAVLAVPCGYANKIVLNCSGHRARVHTICTPCRLLTALFNPNQTRLGDHCRWESLAACMCKSVVMVASYCMSKPKASSLAPNVSIPQYRPSKVPYAKAFVAWQKRSLQPTLLPGRTTVC
jgi:hypothetical protein